MPDEKFLQNVLHLSGAYVCVCSRELVIGEDICERSYNAPPVPEPYPLGPPT